MVSKNRIILLAAATLMIASACQHSAPTADAPASAAPAEPLGFEPIDYFSMSCARCHGDYGANYGDEFGVGLSEAELRKFVDDMASGPGAAPLEGRELDAQVAFHRSMIRKQPFLDWTALNGDAIEGEVMEGSTVHVEIGGKSYPAKVDDARWSFTYPAGVDAASSLSKTVIVAQRKGAETRLPLASQAFSHQDPIQ